MANPPHGGYMGHFLLVCTAGFSEPIIGYFVVNYVRLWARPEWNGSHLLNIKIQ